MKKIILFTLLLIGYSTCIYAQKVIEVTGLVTDAHDRCECDRARCAGFRCNH